LSFFCGPFASIYKVWESVLVECRTEGSSFFLTGCINFSCVDTLESVLPSCFLRNYCSFCLERPLMRWGCRECVGWFVRSLRAMDFLFGKTKMDWAMFLLC